MATDATCQACRSSLDYLQQPIPKNKTHPAKRVIYTAPKSYLLQQPTQIFSPSCPTWWKRRAIGSWLGAQQAAGEHDGVVTCVGIIGSASGFPPSNPPRTATGDAAIILLLQLCATLPPPQCYSVGRHSAARARTLLSLPPPLSGWDDDKAT